MKETGARPGEIARLKWTDVDFERNLIMINDPEKGSNARVVKVSDKAIHMINQLLRKGPKVFPNKHTIEANFYVQRKRIAYKLNNPRLLKIGFCILRHWHGTMEYHKTKDIIHVQQRLGHKSINNTLIYITIEQTLFQEQSDEFTVKVARTLEETCKLVEVGFDYVTEIYGAKIFRKRKWSEL